MIHVYIFPEDPKLVEAKAEVKPKGVVVIGTVKGNYYPIGKDFLTLLK